MADSSKSKTGHLDCALYATRSPSYMRPCEAPETSMIVVYEITAILIFFDLKRFV